MCERNRGRSRVHPRARPRAWPRAWPWAWPWAAALLWSVAAHAPLGAQEFDVDRSADNKVRFVSQTTVDEFDGVTDHIDGYVLLDGTPLSANTGKGETELYLEVDLASLDTGIGLRNRHMRDNYLEVEKYPFATFRGRITASEAGEGASTRVTAHGTFSVHGVDDERDLTCDVTPVGKGYRSHCTFPVLLSDHNIPIPKVMFLKLANEIRVELDFTVTPAGGSSGDLP